MADRSKFEAMLELLVNEDKEGAEALFHEIVVEKSRDIYESLLEDEEVEESDEDLDEADDEEVDESDEDLDEADDEEVEEAEKTPGEQMREYVEKVAPAKHGDNGTNTKSAVAGKNDMGGTTANILRTDTEESGEAGAGTTIKGNPVQKQAPAAMNTKNINVPGGKAGKSSFKKKEPGHGAETKGKPETADKSAGSTLNKLSKRAK